MVKKEQYSLMQKLAKIGKRILLWTSPIWIFHLGTQANYTFNDIKNARNQSEIRRQFQEEFGFPINGFSEDIEEKKGNDISTIAETIRREKLESDFNLKGIRIESDNYLKRSLIEQLVYIFSSGYSGWALDSRIGLKTGTNERLVQHEIKHIKTYQHPRLDALLAEWDQLAKDETGRSLYKYPGKGLVNMCKSQFLEKTRGVDRFNRENIAKSSSEQGFVSENAALNIYEDIAETCEFIESFGDGVEEYSNTKNKNKRISKKIKLAEKYNLLPQLQEVHRIKRLYNAIFEDNVTCDDSMIPNLSRFEAFMQESDKYLANNPNNLHECHIRSLRGNALKIKARNKQELNQAIEEFKKALNSGFKDHISYATSLRDLEECYQRLKDKESVDKIRKAIGLYWDKRNNGYVPLSRAGINDYLGSQGLLSHESRQLTTISRGEK